MNDDTYFYCKLLYTTVSKLKCIPIVDAGCDFYIRYEDRHSEKAIPIYNSLGDFIGFSEKDNEYHIVLNSDAKPQKYISKDVGFEKYNEYSVCVDTNSKDTGDSLSGGKVNYYKVDIETPINDELQPYTAEFEDIALALGLTPMEYNIMKDIWRNANARTNGIGKDGNTQLRTYQKVAHYGNILLKLEERK